MKTKTNLLLTLACFFVVSLFYSCSTSVDIVKRKYNKGFYIDVSSNNVKKSAGNEASFAKTTVEKVTPHSATVQQPVASASDVKENLSIETLTASTGKELPVSITPRMARRINKALATYAMNAPRAEKESVTSVSEMSTNTTEMAAPKQTKSGGKSQLIALLLVIFVGGLGIHRFYLGYTWQGIVQLLTAGGCGIWALIDLIRIITGDLQPKDGRYEKEL